MEKRDTKNLIMVKAFGKAVRFFRKHQGLSQEALSDKAELDRSYMSQIERGIKNATLTSIARIAEALEIKIEDLVHLTEKISEAEQKGQAFGGKIESSHVNGQGRGTSDDGRPTILVADDDEDVCDAVSSILMDSGFVTKIAHSGLDAVRVLSSNTVHALVTDVRMASGNGLELLECVKKNFPGLPVYFITGYEDLSKDEALARGAAGLFNKPFNISEFVATIHAAVS